MKARDYLLTQMKLIKIGKEIGQIELDDFLGAIGTAYTATRKASLEGKVALGVATRVYANLDAMRHLALAYKKVQEQMEAASTIMKNTSAAYLLDAKRGVKTAAPPAEAEEKPDEPVNPNRFLHWPPVDESGEPID